MRVIKWSTSRSQCVAVAHAHAAHRMVRTIFLIISRSLFIISRSNPCTHPHFVPTHHHSHQFSHLYPQTLQRWSSFLQQQQQHTRPIVTSSPFTANRHPKRSPLYHHLTRQTKAVAAAAAAAAEGVVTTEETIPDSSSVRLTVTVPSHMCKKAYRTVLNEWNNKIAITGYRKGRAPENILIEQLGGAKRVYNTVMAELMEAVLASALESTPSAAKAIADSERVEQSGEELENAFDPEKDFTFTVLFETMPALKWSTPYAELSVEVEAASTPERDAGIVADKMRSLLKEGGQLRVVSDRGIQMGDVAIIDFTAVVAESGETIPGASREGMQLDTETADTAFLPGVAATMEGMKPGETRETTITLPNTEDFSPAALRGVKTAVTVTVKEVFEWDLPEANDEWAAKLMGPGSTLADVRTRLEENTAAESEEATRQRMADAFTDAVSAAVEITVPETLLQEAGQNQYTNELNGLLTKGLLSYEQAQQLATPQLLSQFINNKKEELINLQKAALGFADILEKEGLTPSEEDIERELASALASVAEVQGQRGKDINVDAVKEQVVKGLETQAAMNWLFTNCKAKINAPSAALAGGGGGEESPKKKAAPKKKASSSTATTTGEAPKKRGRPAKKTST